MREKRNAPGKAPEGRERKSERRRYLAESARKRDRFGMENFSVLHKNLCDGFRLHFMDWRFYGETLHEPVELCSGQITQVTGVAWPDKMSTLYTFIEEQEAVAFPEKPFNPVSTSATEKEQGIRNEKVYVVLRFNDRGEAVDAVAQVGVAAYDVDCFEIFKVGIFKHCAPP